MIFDFTGVNCLEHMRSIYKALDDRVVSDRMKAASLNVPTRDFFDVDDRSEFQIAHNEWRGWVEENYGNVKYQNTNQSMLIMILIAALEIDRIRDVLKKCAHSDIRSKVVNIINAYENGIFDAPLAARKILDFNETVIKND